MAPPSLARPAPLTLSPASGRAYQVYFHRLANVPALLVDAGLRVGRCLIVTDENVAHHYLPSLETVLQEAGWSPNAVVLSPGEATKSYAPLHEIYDTALAWGLDRKTPVLALGGGVVGDLAGFAAATLLRGLPLVQLPTSLVAQVDSALGGKTGINHALGKNLLGAFHQPALVCADLSVLATLPEREWTSGLAEVLKHALIADTALFDDMESSWDHLLQRAPEVVSSVIPRAAAIKAEVVTEDVHEHERRAILNFGHTFAHAIERIAGYGQFTHGEAVALGMRAALFLSAEHNPDLPVERLDALIQRIPVPQSLSDLPTRSLTEAMYFDKKVEAGRLRFVLLRRLGEAYLTDAVLPDQVNAAWAYAKAP